MNKNIIRKKYLEVRKNISSEDKAKLDEKIFNNFFSLNLIHEKKYFALYYSLPDEVDTKVIMQKLLRMNKKISLPKVNITNQTIDFFLINDIYNDVKTGSFSIFEPHENLIKVNLTELEVIVIPGIAFDRNGNRIGFGKGYYDRLLKAITNAIKIGLCYSAQISENFLISEEHDIKMDFLITENEIIKI